MKLILSRKGFDSGKESGGCPSPIFPDDAMFSLPIPDDDDGARPTYEDLRCTQAENIGELVCNLTHDRIDAERSVHMSPDLNPPSGCPRLFDQVDAAEGHLNNQGVRDGDLFLFFGLYRKVQKTSNEQVWRFDPNAPRQHVLWGWLQVGAKHKQGEGAMLRCSCTNSNTRYVASDHLDLGDGRQALGAGVFPRFDERLLLTDPDGTGVTQWRLPKSFHPCDGKTPLTYYGKREWTLEGDYTYVGRNGPGQEFVLNLDEYPEVKDWALDLIRGPWPTPGEPA